MKSDVTAQRVLTINIGSSSLKVALYEMGQEETRLLTGEVERIGRPASRLRIADGQGATLIDHESNLPDHGVALVVVLGGLDTLVFTAGIGGARGVGPQADLRGPGVSRRRAGSAPQRSACACHFAGTKCGHRPRAADR